ncbi:hypothetical protein OSB04_025851 [Centaurea solstitialis]|uniref:K Homology domain-containing protein n=1 Tax=Centaurea solstitialis TaxID=347529 RepID=A0AA38SQH1_9ASTR|nr:hypothetical protein OSB04_025851 [Centaurea solstitialis]
MDRSRSKRYYYDHQDYDHMETLPRTKPRYNNNNNYSGGGGGGGGGGHYGGGPNNHHHQRRNIGGGGGRKPPQEPPSSLMVTTSYRILCHDAKAGSVIGKSGSIIKAIRQHTGAWINVHELMPGDEERIIEISDTRRRDPDGRMPSFSPAQEALLLIHERILESDGGGGGYNLGYGGGGDEDEDMYGPRGGGMGANRLVTRLVVSRMHVGCLLGKGGKIIEQMRMETKTHIRVLPRDHTIPRCVEMSEEIVQVVGEMTSVKNAIEIISSRLRESQHRDRSHFHGRLQSPDRFFPPEEDFMHHQNNIARRPSMDGPPNYGSRVPGGLNNARSFNHASRPSSYINDTGASPVSDNAQPVYAEDLVFRILCPNNKVDSVIGQSDGFMELLRNEIGVEVKVADLAVGSDEQILIISSEEGPDDELFPAQEALLHIQTRILDLVPEKENIITTRLLLSAGEIGCLDGRDGFLSETKKMTGADIQILPRENLPQFVSVNEELVQQQKEEITFLSSYAYLCQMGYITNSCIIQTRLHKLENHCLMEVFTWGRRESKEQLSVLMLILLFEQIVGEIKAAREALVEVTLRLRSYLFQGFYPKDAQPPPFHAPSPVGSASNLEAASSNNTTPRETYAGNDSTIASQMTSASVPAKITGGSNSDAVNQNESGAREDAPSAVNRVAVPLVTRSILEVVIPDYAVPKLITKSRNKLAQISEYNKGTSKV